MILQEGNYIFIKLQGREMFADIMSGGCLCIRTASTEHWRACKVDTSWHNDINNGNDIENTIDSRDLNPHHAGDAWHIDMIMLNGRGNIVWLQPTGPGHNNEEDKEEPQMTELKFKPLPA